MAVTRYFLGGNTASGFVSFYGQFCRGPEDFLWVIKGGPGCGKSSFMKTIGKAAENAGLDVEYVLCSGDPDSVDGVYLPALHTGLRRRHGSARARGRHAGRGGTVSRSGAVL